MDDTPKDEFKWFGEGFDGFPKRLPEDTVEYVIHIVDKALNDAQTRTRSNEVLKAANELEKSVLKNYLWQRDPFKLHLQREDSKCAINQ